MNKAQEASQKTNIATAKDECTLTAINANADAYQRSDNKTVQQVVKEALAAKNGMKFGNAKIVVSDGTVTISTAGYELVGIVDEHGVLNWGKIESNTPGTDVNVPKVGDIVNYAPSGTYSWNKTLASADQTGTVTLSSASEQTYNITQWKILSYDPNTKMVEMVPTAPVGSLRLQGAQGYNNAVYLLNNACSSLYGNSAKGITARSIKEEDFVKAGKQSQEGDSETKNDWTRARANYNNNEINIKYGEQTTAYTSDNKSYPSIYANEYGSVINGTENTGATALKRSEQSNSIGRTDNSAINGYLTASTSIQPYQTYYNTSSYSITSELLADGKAAVLMPNGSSTTPYWVASRCVCPYSVYGYFYVRIVTSGYMGARIVFSSGTGTNANTTFTVPGLFPVVSFNASLLEETETSGTWNVNVD